MHGFLYLCKTMGPIRNSTYVVRSHCISREDLESNSSAGFLTNPAESPLRQDKSLKIKKVARGQAADLNSSRLRVARRMFGGASLAKDLARACGVRDDGTEPTWISERP